MKQWIVTVRVDEIAEAVVIADTEDEAKGKAEAGDYIDRRTIDTRNAHATSAVEDE